MKLQNISFCLFYLSQFTEKFLLKSVQSMFISLDHHCYPVPDILYCLLTYWQGLLSSAAIFANSAQVLASALSLLHEHFLWQHPSFISGILINFLICFTLHTVSLTPYSAAFSCSSLSKFKFLCIKSQTVTWQLAELVSSLGMMCVSAQQNSETQRPKAAL